MVAPNWRTDVRVAQVNKTGTAIANMRLEARWIGDVVGCRRG